MEVLRILCGVTVLCKLVISYVLIPDLKCICIDLCIILLRLKSLSLSLSLSHTHSPISAVADWLEAGTRSIRYHIQ